MRQSGDRGRGGFNPLEIVIVVAILSILAAIGIPRMSRGSRSPHDSALSGSLAVLRQAIDLYAAEHGGSYPAADRIEDALTLYSDASGATSEAKTPRHIYGPYLRDVPALPVGAHKGKTGFSATDDPNAGWIYNASTGRINANATDEERDAAGRAYNSY